MKILVLFSLITLIWFGLKPKTTNKASSAEANNKRNNKITTTSNHGVCLGLLRDTSTAWEHVRLQLSKAALRYQRLSDAA